MSRSTAKISLKGYFSNIKPRDSWKIKYHKHGRLQGNLDLKQFGTWRLKPALPIVPANIRGKSETFYRNNFWTNKQPDPSTAAISRGFTDHTKNLEMWLIRMTTEQALLVERIFNLQKIPVNIQQAPQVTILTSKPWPDIAKPISSSQQHCSLVFSREVSWSQMLTSP